MLAIGLVSTSVCIVVYINFNIWFVQHQHQMINDEAKKFAWDHQTTVREAFHTKKPRRI